VARIARLFGRKIDLIVAHDSLLVDVDDGPASSTGIDSSPRVTGLNLTGLVRVRKWLSEGPAAASAPEDLEAALCALRDAPPVHHAAVQAVAAGCAGTCFCMVNGGDPLSWGCSFVGSALIFALRRLLAARKSNYHMTIFVVALVGSLVSALLARLAGAETLAVAMVAPVLFLVPGAPLIGGGIDIVHNHVSVGLARIGFSMAVVVALSLGVGLSLPLLPPRVHEPFSLPEPWGIVLFTVASALAAGAIACLSNGGWSLAALCALGGLMGRLVRALAAEGGVDIASASLAGAVCATLLVSVISSRLRWPAMIAAVMAALPMVPGYFAIAGIHSLLVFSKAGAPDPHQLALAARSLSLALFITVALVAGVVGPVMILQPDRDKA
jgi:uncharacterized membrane protein YjjP (DUF1212 family)